MDEPRRCWYCACEMVPGSRRGSHPPNMATRQHILPRWRGGTKQKENLRPCCLSCNWLLEAAGDCPGTLACAIALVDLRWPRSQARRYRRIRSFLWDWLPKQHHARARRFAKAAAAMPPQRAAQAG